MMQCGQQPLKLRLVMYCINNAHDAAMISNECASKHSLLVLTPPKLLYSSSCVLLKKNRMQGLWLLVPCDGGRAEPQSFITITDCLVAFWHSLFESMFFKQALLFCLCFPFWSVVCLLTFSRKSDFKLADSRHMIAKISVLTGLSQKTDLHQQRWHANTFGMLILFALHACKPY